MHLLIFVSLLRHNPWTLGADSEDSVRDHLQPSAALILINPLVPLAISPIFGSSIFLSEYEILSNKA